MYIKNVNQNGWWSVNTITYICEIIIDQSENEEENDGKKSKPEAEEEEAKKERLDKKRKLKEMFDAEYDEGDATYFDDLKEEMHKQAQVQTASLSFFLTVCLQKYPTVFAQRSFLETREKPNNWIWFNLI